MDELTVLVTGPRGLLGAALMPVLSNAGFRVMPFDGDIMDRAAVQVAARNLGPSDWIIHAAAATDVNRCERDRVWCYAVNIHGTRNIRDAAVTRGARLIFISTASVFSGEEGGYCEQDLPYPKNFYNLTKYVGEVLAGEYVNATTLRLNLIGIHPKGSRGRNFFEWLLDTVRSDGDMRLFTDARINPLSNWTVADYVRDLIGRPAPPKVLHLASRDVLSKADIGRFVVARFPAYNGKIMFTTSCDNLSTAAHRPKEMWLNAEAAVRYFGAKPPTIESEIERIFSLLPPGGCP